MSMTAPYCTPRNIYNPLTYKGFVDMVRRAVKVVYRISCCPWGNRKTKGADALKHRPLLIRARPATATKPVRLAFPATRHTG